MASGQIPTRQIADFDDAVDARITLAGSGNFHFVQVAPASVWYVAHNLGRIPPSPTIICDSDPGVPVYTDVYHDDENNLTVTFPSPETGTVDL